jgi:hypothetical protein
MTRRPAVIGVAGCIVTFVMFVTACTEKLQPVIIMDRWWNVDFAKAGCGAKLPAGYQDPGLARCQEQEAEAERAFETDLDTQFASQPDCGGIELIGFMPGANSDKLSKAMKQPYWDLSLNFEDDQRVQDWKILAHNGIEGFGQGSGDARRIASDVCSFVKRRGAAVIRQTTAIQF